MRSWSARSKGHSGVGGSRSAGPTARSSRACCHRRRRHRIVRRGCMGTVLDVVRWVSLRWRRTMYDSSMRVMRWWRGRVMMVTVCRGWCNRCGCRSCWRWSSCNSSWSSSKLIIKGTRIALQNSLSSFFNGFAMQCRIVTGLTFTLGTTCGTQSKTLTVQLQAPIGCNDVVME